MDVSSHKYVPDDVWRAAVSRMDSRMQARQVSVERKIRDAMACGRYEISLHADNTLVAPLGTFNAEGRLEYSAEWQRLLDTL